jgi:hypothetical protein
MEAKKNKFTLLVNVFFTSDFFNPLKALERIAPRLHVMAMKPIPKAAEEHYFIL